MVIFLELRQLNNVISTVSESLETWVQRLVERPFLELGDDASIIERLYVEINQLDQPLRAIRHHFDLKRGISAKEVDRYYTAVGMLNELRCFVEAVKDSREGSRDNTYECIHRLRQCQAALTDLRRHTEQRFQRENKSKFAKTLG